VLTFVAMPSSPTSPTTPTSTTTTTSTTSNNNADENEQIRNLAIRWGFFFRRKIQLSLYLRFKSYSKSHYLSFICQVGLHFRFLDNFAWY
jgi:hypothetical protein